MCHSTPDNDDEDSATEAVEDEVRESIRQLAEGEAATEDDLDDALLF